MVLVLFSGDMLCRTHSLCIENVMAPFAWSFQYFDLCVFHQTEFRPYENYGIAPGSLSPSQDAVCWLLIRSQRFLIWLCVLESFSKFD